MQITFSELACRLLNALRSEDRRAFTEIIRAAEDLERCSLIRIMMMRRSYMLTERFKLHFRLEELPQHQGLINVWMIERLQAFAQDKVADHERPRLVATAYRSQRALLIWATGSSSERKGAAATSSVRVKTFSYAEHGIFSKQTLTTMKPLPRRKE